MLNVNEIFFSIQGESSYTGWPCVFVRLSGCNLQCAYCDTQYASRQHTPITVDEIIERINGYACSLVEITGGEPLIQDETPELIRTLSNHGMRVLLETNGSQNIDRVDGNVIRIMDIKCPSSGESDRMDWGNINRLKPQDEVKFVLVTRSDYDWAKQVIDKYGLVERVKVLVSPVHGRLDPARLADWVLEDRLDVRLQLQLHKIIWPDQKRGK